MKAAEITNLILIIIAATCYGIEIQETLTPETATKIFEEHGELKTGAIDPCQNVDSPKENSNRIYGDALCHYATVTLFHLNPQQDYGLHKSVCARLAIKPLFSTKKSKEMVRCTYGPEKSQKFYLFQGPAKDYYYIARYEPDTKDVHIISCLRIILDLKKDFPPIECRETYNAIEADNIFGKFGQVKSKKGENNAIWKPQRKGDLTMYQKLKNQFIRDLFDLFQKQKGDYEERQVERLILDRKTGNPKRTKKIRMSKFYFSNGQSFYLLTGPTEELFYLAMLISDDNGVDSKYPVTIVQCIRFPK